MGIVIFLIWLALLLCTVTALDVSFIPNDENAPLPLSAKYRDNLRKLCDLLDNGSPMSGMDSTKKKSLRSMCRKLKKDDDNIEAGTSNPFANVFAGQNFKKLILTILGVGGGYIIFKNHSAILTNLRKLFMPPKGVKLGGSWEERGSTGRIEVVGADASDTFNAIDMMQETLRREAREARLKRFEEMSSGSSDENNEN